MRKMLKNSLSIILVETKFDIFSCLFLVSNLQANQVLEIGLLHFHKPIRPSKEIELILLSESICVVFYRVFGVKCNEENVLQYPFNRSSSSFEDSVGKSGLKNCPTWIPQIYKTEWRSICIEPIELVSYVVRYMVSFVWTLTTSWAWIGDGTVLDTNSTFEELVLSI